jgi:type IV secretion system protein VirD4
MDLDEAAIICPIPLDSWTADMGGRNITIRITAQSRPQLRQRWGHDGAAAIVNNAASLMIFGGTRNTDDLQDYSLLIGDREQRIVTRDHTGKVLSESTERVPILTPAQIAQLPEGRVVVIRRGMPPVIGKVKMAWQRPYVRAIKRRDRRQARAAVWARRGATAQRLARDLADAVQEMAAEVAELWAQWQQRRAQRRTASPQPIGAARTDDAVGGESDA